MREHMITDGQARVIAEEWRSPGSPLVTLSTTGAITDLVVMRAEISRLLMTLDVGEVRRDLLALDVYAREHGQRGAVPGWTDVEFDRTPVTIDQC